MDKQHLRIHIGKHDAQIFINSTIVGRVERFNMCTSNGRFHTRWECATLYPLVCHGVPGAGAPLRSNNDEYPLSCTIATDEKGVMEYDAWFRGKHITVHQIDMDLTPEKNAVRLYTQYAPTVLPQEVLDTLLTLGVEIIFDAA